MPAFTELKTFKEALAYIKKTGVDFKEGSNEYNNLKMMYDEMVGKMGYKMGVLRKLCKCGYVGDDGQLMSIKPGDKNFETWTKTEETPMIMCQRCMELSMILISGFNFDDKQARKVLDFVYDLKKG